MDGTGEHYAKRNKPGSEGQIPHDLTYKWNLINKTNKQAKQNQRHGNKAKLTVTREEGRGDNGGGEGGRVVRNTYKGPMDKAKGGGKDGGWEVGGEWRQLYLNNNKKREKK